MSTEYKTPPLTVIFLVAGPVIGGLMGYYGREKPQPIPPPPTPECDCRCKCEVDIPPCPSVLPEWSD